MLNSYQWAEGLGVEADTVEELIAEDNPEIKSDIMDGIKKINKRAVSNAAKVELLKWKVLLT